MRVLRTAIAATAALAVAVAVGWFVVQTRLGVGAPVTGVTEVRMLLNDFSPEHVEVSPGTTVTWHWAGVEHDLTGDGWGTPARRDDAWSHTFTTAGSYDYRCTLHEPMRGRVTVR